MEDTSSICNPRLSHVVVTRNPLNLKQSVSCSQYSADGLEPKIRHLLGVSIYSSSGSHLHCLPFILQNTYQHRTSKVTDTNRAHIEIRRLEI
jgi:hypothetical protein